MLKIFKYEIEITEEQVIMLPEGAVILHFGLQKDVPYIWVRVEEHVEKVKRHFKVVGPGHVFEDYALEYVGTVVNHKGYFVWHLYENLRPSTPTAIPEVG